MITLNWGVEDGEDFIINIGNKGGFSKGNRLFVFKKGMGAGEGKTRGFFNSATGKYNQE